MLQAVQALLTRRVRLQTIATVRAWASRPGSGRAPADRLAWAVRTSGIVTDLHCDLPDLPEIGDIYLIRIDASGRDVDACRDEPLTAQRVE